MKQENLAVLGQRIEEILLEHIHACRKMAHDSIDRIFSEAMLIPKQRKEKCEERKKHNTPRRTVAVVNELSQRLYRLLRKNPGSTMRDLAKELGVSSAYLYKSMQDLKESGCARSIGQTNFTKYFPIEEESSSVA